MIGHGEGGGVVAVAQVLELIAGPGERELRLAVLALPLGDHGLELGDLGGQLPNLPHPRENPGLGGVASSPHHAVGREHVAGRGREGAREATGAVDVVFA